MLVFIDECLPAHSFRSIFEERGHTVRSVGEGFPSGSPDRAILAAAEDLGAVVVSTDAHWEGLMKNVADEGERGRFKSAGRILFKCSHEVAIERLRKHISKIENDYVLTRQEGVRLIVRISGGNYRVDY